jgi:preprotein translocase subunit SecD
MLVAVTACGRPRPKDDMGMSLDTQGWLVIRGVDGSKDAAQSSSDIKSSWLGGPIYLQPRVLADSEMLVAAQPSKDASGKPSVVIEWNAKAGERLTNYWLADQHALIAVIIDGKLFSVGQAPGRLDHNLMQIGPLPDAAQAKEFARLLATRKGEAVPPQFARPDIVDNAEK